MCKHREISTPNMDSLLDRPHHRIQLTGPNQSIPMIEFHKSFMLIP